MSLSTENRTAQIDVSKVTLLENVVEAIDQGFAVWDDEYLLVICNQRFRDMWEFPDELAQPGVTADTLLRHHLEGEQRYGKTGDVAFEKEVAHRFKHIAESYQQGRRERFSHFSGRELLIRYYISPDLGNVSTYSDVTSLKKTEDRLIRKTDQLQNTLNAIDQGVVIWSDADNEKMELCNDRFLELWGYPPEFGTPGTRALDFLLYDAQRGEMGPGDPEKLARDYLKKVQSYYDNEVEDLHTTRTGKTLYIRRRIIEGFGSVSTFTDVSGLKKTEDDLRETQKQLQDQIDRLQHREAELEKQKSDLERLTSDLDKARAASVRQNESKDRLFSILAHDLLGPFNAIIGYSSLLKKRAGQMTTEKMVEAAGAINESATGLHQLLASLLEWSRRQMDGASVEPVDVELDLVAAEVRDLFLASARQKTIEIVSRFNAVVARTDANMVAVILRNLLSNAIKFTPEGGTIELVVRAEGDQAIIEVSDTGIGLSPDQFDDVFSLEGMNFTAGTRGETGTGLGLQVCRDFVEQLGGRISLEGKEGAGSCFRVTLPLEFNG